MQEFREMVDLVTNRLQKKIEIIDFSNTEQEQNLYVQLFKGIHSNEFSTDKAAATALYDTHEGDKKYLMLKSRLKERLINTFLFLDFEKKTDSELLSATQRANKLYYATKLLASAGGKESTIFYAKNCLAIAQKFEFNDLILSCSKILRLIYGDKGNTANYNKYVEMSEKALFKIGFEEEADILYQRVKIDLVKTKASTDKALALAEKNFKKLQSISKKADSFNVDLAMYRTGLIYFQIARKYREAINLCNEFEAYLASKPHFTFSERVGELYVIRMSCYLTLKDYENGQKNAERSLVLFKAGMNNWFVMLEYYFLLAMHTGNYKKAQEIFNIATNNERFKLQSDYHREQWTIFEAYVFYVNESSGRFNMLKFLNNIPIFMKDKKGNYPAILIAQIIHLYKSKKEDEAESRVESLRKNLKRYMNNQNAIRTILFIKLLKKLNLRKVYKSGFEKKTAPLLKALNEVEFDDPRNNDSFEVIPYELLWELILKNS